MKDVYHHGGGNVVKKLLGMSERSPCTNKNNSSSDCAIPDEESFVKSVFFNVLSSMEAFNKIQREIHYIPEKYFPFNSAGIFLTRII